MSKINKYRSNILENAKNDTCEVIT